MDSLTEIQTKLNRVRALMDAKKVDTLWLQRVENVAWITAGIDTAVNTSDAVGVASIVITADSRAMWTNTIEAPRMQAEDHIRDLGFDLHVSPWEAPSGIPQATSLGVDFPMPGAVDLNGDLGRLRSRLLPAEQQRFRELGKDTADAMQHAINRVKPGATESEIAAALYYETRCRDMTPVVVLIGTDERVHNVRHPLPLADKIMEKYAMLVVCARRYGLVCSVTRLVHFGPLPDDLRRRMEATAEVDATMLAASQPGATLEDVFRAAQDAYTRAGFADEWKLHHQGGIAGYTAREALGVPGEKLALEPGMVCAWNPSISGAKSEDSVMVTEAGKAPDNLTWMLGWPTRTIEINGMSIERPLILEA